MYLTPTLLACLLLGQTAGDSRSRVRAYPAVPGLPPSVVIPEPEQVPTLGDRDGVGYRRRLAAAARARHDAGFARHTDRPRTDFPPAEPSTIPKTAGGSEDRVANPPTPRQSHRLTAAQMVAVLCGVPQPKSCPRVRRMRPQWRRVSSR